MVLRLLFALLALLVPLGAAAPAFADDGKKRAAEHFALGEAAEQRKDWRAAIDQFKLAYDIKPHPAVLYKVARNYERLEDWDSAIEYYERYLEESPQASDRDRVDQKLAELREKAVHSRPVPRGGTGLLVVHANVDGAKVRIDGQVAGETPFRALVAAGPHAVSIEAEGYTSASRSVEIPAGGTQQIREQLELVGDAPVTGLGGFVVGVGYGYSIASDSPRVVVNLGYRLPNGRAEVNLLYGIFARNDTGFGADARLYLGRNLFRPYVRASITIGKATSEELDGTQTLAVEGQGGVLIALTRSGTRSLTELYLEVGVRYTIAGVDEAPDGASYDTNVPLTIPVQLGYQAKF